MGSHTEIHVTIRNDEEDAKFYATAGNWRNIIFVPYQMMWRCFIVLTVGCNLVLVLYFLTFNEEFLPFKFVVPFYMFEVIYFVDTVLVIMHRTMREYQKTRPYVPRHLLLVTVDVITLVPYYELYYLLRRSSDGIDYDFAKDYVKFKILLRLQTVVEFLLKIRNQPGLNQIVIVVGTQLFEIAFFSVALACLWYSIKDASVMNWQSNLNLYVFDRNSSFEWFIVSLSTIGACFAHNWSGSIGAENSTEYVIVIMTMMLGCLLHVMIFFGDLTTQYIKKLKYQFDFSARVKIIIHMLDDWHIEDNVKKKTVQYYNKYWERRYGLLSAPDLFYKLPMNLQKEACVDVFWDMFKHSHFFGDTEISFKRSLSLGLKCDFFIPGDHLFSADNYKTKVVYIVSGVVQILSQEDEKSPVMSFSSGTLFGEITSVVCMTCNTNIRCATYVEVFTLNMEWLCRLLVNYPLISIMLHRKINDRISRAKTLQHPVILRERQKEQKKTSICWIKNQWRHVMKNSRTEHKLEDTIKYNVSPLHISNYLDMYVLSDEVELKMKAICLRSHCPYVVDPSSDFYKFCSYLILAAIGFQTTLVPYIVFFVGGMSSTMSGFFYMLDLCYIFGLYLEASTAVKKKTHMIVNTFDILIYKGKRFATLVDILSTIPFELIAYSLNYSQRIQLALHLNRILKIHNLYTIIRTFELNLWSDCLRLRLIKYTLSFIYVIYFFACLLYGSTCFNGCDKYGWYTYNNALDDIYMEDLGYKRPSPFLTSIVYSTSTLMSLTDTHYHSFTVLDLIIQLILTVAGYFLFSFCFSELAACAVLQLNEKSKYQEYLMSLKNFVHRNSIPAEMKQMMYEVVECQWNYNKGYPVTGKESILADAPDSIKTDVILSRIAKHLMDLPLFKYCDDNLVWNLASFATLNVLPPGSVLLKEDTYTTSLKIILRGYCRVESGIPSDKYHQYSNIVTCGYVFPVVELLLNISTFLNVTSITFVEIATIPYKKLIVQLRQSTEYYRDLRLVLDTHMKEYDTILMRRKGRLPEMVSSQKSYGKSNFFTYTTNENFDVDPSHVRYMAPFLKLGKWRFLRHFLLRQTLNPTKIVYITWECIRCAVSCANILYVLLIMKHAMQSKWFRYTTIYFEIVGMVDFYIKMHCQYYNSKGIIVTHPLYTAKNYFCTSFLLDLYCIFPFALFNLQRMFKGVHEYRSVTIIKLLTRPLLLYRVFFGLSYLQTVSKEGKAVIIAKFKYGILVSVVLGVMACFLELITCSYDSSYEKYKCPNDSWIGRSFLGKDITKENIACVCYYQVLNIFSTSSVGAFIIKSQGEYISFLFAVTILFSTRWFVLAKITSTAIGGNTTLIVYQANMKAFLTFVRRHYVQEYLVRETTEHYKNIWKRTNGNYTADILRTFESVLRCDFTQFLYSPCLNLVDIFSQVDQSAIRHFSVFFKELHFKKKAEIIRCNDVQEYIYIVYKGRVQISVAHQQLAMLTPGGMFGCLTHGKIRQTIAARATVHTDVLVITGSKLNKIVNNYPDVKAKIRNAVYLHAEYFPPTSVTSNIQEGRKSCFPMKMSNYAKRFLVNPDSNWYAMYNYIVSVHISTISSLMIMVMIVQVGTFTMGYFYHAIYGFDVIFLFKIVLGFHLTYVDYESGLRVTSVSKISKRYLKSPNGFFWELFTCFPFELIVQLVTDNFVAYRYSWCNRLFRFFFLVNYYNSCKNKITVSKSLRWAYLMYLMIFLIHLMSCIWWIVACNNETCTFLQGSSYGLKDFRTTNDSVLAFRIAYQYVVNVFTSTGLRDQMPMNIMQLLTSSFIICVSQIVLLALTAGFASMLLLGNFGISLYEKKVEHVRHYLKTADLSMFILNKIWNYYVEMWIRASGSWIPELIEQAPPYLKQDIMFALYGKHLMRHPLFATAHVDFIRQLVVHFQVFMYFPGQYIVEKGDTDGCMYFIDSGKITVYDKEENNEVEECVLATGSVFGEIQGIFNYEHDKSFKAKVVSTILILRKSDWDYLLQWFPATKESLLAYEVETHPYV